MLRKILFAAFLMSISGSASASWHVYCQEYESFYDKYFWYDTGASFSSKAEAEGKASRICDGKSYQVKWRL